MNCKTHRHKHCKLDINKTFIKAGFAVIVAICFVFHQNPFDDINLEMIDIDNIERDQGFAIELSDELKESLI